MNDFIDDDLIRLSQFPETLGRDPRYFIYPKPSIFDRFKAWAQGPAPLLFPPERVLAVDMSQYQNQDEVDYQQLYAGGFRLVILKATEGVAWPDPMFDWHWRNALDNGFYV